MPDMQKFLEGIKESEFGQIYTGMIMEGLGRALQEGHLDATMWTEPIIGDIAENFPRILLGGGEAPEGTKEEGGIEKAKMWLMENYGEMVSGDVMGGLWNMLMESAFNAMQRTMDESELFREHYNPMEQ
jgi:hypothetical protein